ncbi:hypothetical protein JAAARDRAFT_185989 [Jaapia argillacea MUCL 33604]|uniref:Calcineurin-like phosphoesterase domain-containing protein n=1 Tax=Jaapia argillacea MUCL 33604 TaxID=933084 RepID=A0A067P7L0_9AGAM|nr:hypothetical protein JAAARDRAFT_185989 [Jaapia argillacea MUCL 33604]
MAKFLGRFFRYLRSICAPMSAIIGFSCLLTFIFILYQPTPGPGELQRMGWQSWDVISMDAATGSEGNVSLPTVPEGVDWWNVTQEEEYVDPASLPLDVWSPLLPHNTGLSEITIERCMFDPMLAPSLCVPDSTPEQDAVKGKWVQVGTNINAQTGMWYLNIFYRRTRRLDVPLVTDLLLLPTGETPPIANYPDAWHKVSRSIRDGVPRTPALYLWYKTGDSLQDIGAKGGNRANLIMEIDILFGDDKPWYGFDKIEIPVLETTPRQESVWVTYRQGLKPVVRAQPLHFSHDGNFKVLQVADLHFSVSPGKCRDTDLSPCTHSDNLTSTLLSHVISLEQPDFIVFTGDQLNGQGYSWDAKSVLAKFARAVTDAKIPWTAVFGNHDDEDGVASKEEQLKMMMAMPYSKIHPGPKGIHGVGNHVLKVHSADPSMTQLLTMYFLDSGAYSSGFMDWFGWFHPTEYDWIHQDQIDWFLKESGKMKAIERPFTPDGAKDLGDSWKRQASQLPPDAKKLAKPNALMFFHIPLQESYSDPDINTSTDQLLNVGIHDLEGSGAAKKSDGFFEKALLSAKESEHVAGGSLPEVKVVGNGHCHVTENCKRVKGVWLCFGGGGSYSGYSRVGFDRRFRIYDISDYGETIRTYKRTEHDEIVDDMILAGRGAPPPYEGLP